MKLKSILYIASIFFLISLQLKAQETFDYRIYDHKVLEHQTLSIFSVNGLITLFAIKPNEIKVSFSSKQNNEKQSDKKDNGVYVRVTQNLESVFMQTDSLLIMISKLDFSIKFLNRKEELYFINKSVSFANNYVDIKLSIADDVFYKKTHKRIKPKKYSFEKLKSIHSSKQYYIYFDDKVEGGLDFSKKSILKMRFFKASELGYYFSTGS